MQQKTESQSCAITDANILINFIKIGRVDILQQLRMYAFYLSEEVYREITYPAQRLVLDHALKNGWLRETVITDQNELRSYAQYRRQMGDGEAACLAIAICRKWIMACDEQKKKLISRTVRHHLGAGYLLNTPGILSRPYARAFSLYHKQTQSKTHWRRTDLSCHLHLSRILSEIGHRPATKKAARVSFLAAFRTSLPLSYPLLEHVACHRLSGNRQNAWSISISGNWRIAFEEDEGCIDRLNLEDYH